LLWLVVIQYGESNFLFAQESASVEPDSSPVFTVDEEALYTWKKLADQMSIKPFDRDAVWRKMGRAPFPYYTVIIYLGNDQLVDWPPRSDRKINSKPTFTFNENSKPKTNENVVTLQSLLALDNRLAKTTDENERYDIYGKIIDLLGNFSISKENRDFADLAGQAAWEKKALNEFSNNPTRRLNIHQKYVGQLTALESQKTKIVNQWKDTADFDEKYCHNHEVEFLSDLRHELAAAKGRLCGDFTDQCIPSDFAFMARGYFYAGSNYAGPNEGGFAPSDNLPKNIESSMKDVKDQVYLVTFPDKVVNFGGGYRGMRVLLINGTSKQQAFSASDSMLPIIQEAKDENGAWKPIEYLPSSTDGNSYHTVYLDPKQYWQFSAPKYEGKVRTTLRFTMNGGQIVSNEFQGSINPEQFTLKQGHRPSDVMDPYFD